MSITTRVAKGAPLTFTEMDNNFLTLAALINSGFNYSVDIGSVNALAITLSAPPAAYFDGMNFSTKVANTTTSTATLNINGLGAKNIYDEYNTLLPAGLLIVGQIYTFVYNSSLNGGVGGFNTYIANTGTQPYLSTNPGAIATTVQAALGRRVHEFDFMTPAQQADVIAGTLTIDVSSAIQAALNSSGVFAVELYPTAHKLSSGIMIPVGVGLYSTGFYPSNTPTGCQLVFDLSVTTCLTLGGLSANNGSAGSFGFTVTRAAGTIPASSIGILVQNCYNPILNNLNSTRHAIPWKFLSDGTHGIACNASGLYSGAATDAHIVIDTWPELRITQSRFGMNGSGDVNCNTYIRLQGGSTLNASAGPNTLYISNTQFNQGQNAATHWIEFVNQLPSSIADITEFSFDNVHVEALSGGGAYLFSDSTWPTITRFKAATCHFNSITEFIGLNSVTTVNDWQIGDSFVAGTFTLAPSAQFNYIGLETIDFTGLVSITSANSNTTVHLSNNNYHNGITLAGAFSNASWCSGIITNSVLTLTATGIGVDVGPNNISKPWTPAIALGGGTTGITYTTQTGTYTLKGRKVKAQFFITLSNKGTSTGAVTVTGLPFVQFNGFGTGVLCSANNFAGLTGTLCLGNANGTTTFPILQSIATGISSITDGNLTNTTTFTGAFEFDI